MLAVDRRRKILDELNALGSIMVTDMSVQFGVTEETIRRDLGKLEKEGLLRRIHGGAISLKTKHEYSYQIRSHQQVAEKQAIARKAREYICNGDTLLLDASTTVLCLSNLLEGFRDLTVITNSVLMTLELANMPNITTICTGGLLRPNSLSYVGPLTNQGINRYHADKLFFSGKGISVSLGLTDSNEMDIEVKQTMVKQAKEVILLIDHTKFSQTGLTQIAPLHNFDRIITDSGIRQEDIADFAKNGIDIEVAEIE